MLKHPSAPGHLVELVETELPAVNLDKLQIEAESIEASFYRIAQSQDGEEIAYARAGENIQIFRRTKEGHYTFSVNLEPGREDTYFRLAHCLEPVAKIHASEALEVMKVIYSFHSPNSDDVRYRSDILSALLDYAQKQVE